MSFEQFSGRNPEKSAVREAKLLEEVAICGECDCDMMYPIDWKQLAGSSWQITLRCPNCEGVDEAVMDEVLIEKFDCSLDRDTDSLVRDLRDITCMNMVTEFDTIIEAFQGDHILPVDFGWPDEGRIQENTLRFQGEIEKLEAKEVGIEICGDCNDDKVRLVNVECDDSGYISSYKIDLCCGSCGCRSVKNVSEACIDGLKQTQDDQTSLIKSDIEIMGAITSGTFSDAIANYVLPGHGNR